jgi:uncharacterized membrane protein YdjX (TVP38/TMEM64 family)
MTVNSQGLSPEENAAISAQPTSFWGRNWQKIGVVSIWIGLVVAYFVYSYNTYGSFFAFDRVLQDLVGVLRSPIGPLIYILIYSLRSLASLSAVVLTLLGGAIWGPFWGILYTIIAANGSAVVAYYLGRFVGGGIIDENETGGIVGRYSKRLRDNSFETILTMRLIFLPYDAVSYLAGFLRIHLLPFILGTALGSLAGTITFVLLGASLDLESIFAGEFNASLNPWSLVAAAVIFVVSIGISRYFKAREARRQARQGATAEDASEDSAR